jgi:hypothetical protein
MVPVGSTAGGAASYSTVQLLRELTPLVTLDKSNPLVKRVTQSNSLMVAYVFPEVAEPPSEDDSGPEGSLTGSDAAKGPAVHTKKAGCKGTSTTADQRRGRTSTSAAVVAGNSRCMWDASEDHSPPAAVPRPTPKSVGSSNSIAEE